MDSFEIQTASKTYPIFIGNQVAKKLPPFLQEKFPGRKKLFLITDSHVAALHADSLTRLLNQSGYDTLVHIVPSGEAAKSLSCYEECMTKGFSHHIGREGIILALGGGVIGDLAGFVAATYMRGIPFIQLPTTLLAHDSAVGGKVGINHSLGKNLIGAFYQPEAVVYDISYLQTLPEREWRSGFAELIKHAFLSSEAFYHELRNEIKTIDDLRNHPKLGEWIEQGIKVKASIVAEDERESGKRAFLNLGHTLAHAMEGAAGYGELTHGEAVAFGLFSDLYLSRKYTGLDIDLDSLYQWLINLGYLTVSSDVLDIDRLIPYMKLDKKNQDGKIATILLKKFGEPILSTFDEEEIRQDFAEFIGYYFAV
jgi:3-dehydroquinate synthase